MNTFSHYLQLYTLHFVEQHTPHQRLIHVRLSTVKYLLTNLPTDIEATWQQDQNIAHTLIQQATAERVQLLLEDDAIQQQLLATRWQPYQALRQQSALPDLRPLIQPAPHSGFDRRLDQAERVLQLMKTTLEVANAGLILWQTWQASRNERQQLLEAIRTTLVGQSHALEAGNTQDFIAGYLSAHANDPIHPLLFDANEEDD